MRPLLLLILAAAAFAQDQPIPYSHKQHLAMGLKCGFCHENADPGEMMGIPDGKKCMTCHSTVKPDSPQIQKLTAMAKRPNGVPWVRVYQIPSYVMFSHRTHTQAGNTCETCHGPVAQREQIKKETDISMGGCMSCHTAKKAPNECTSCHEEKK